jgi:protein TonB
MKKIVFGLVIVLFAIGGSSVFAQTPKQTDKSVYSVVEQMPEFVGGQDAMNKFIQSKIVSPQEALDKKIGGNVYVQFIVEADGSLSEFEVVRGLGYGLDSAAYKSAKQMPNWIPGKQGGKTVRVKCVIPVQFVVDTPKKRYVN